MPVQGRTRKQLRQSIGYNLGAIYVSSASGNGDSTSLIDNTLIGGDDNYIGYNALFTSGTNDGLIRRVIHRLNCIPCTICQYSYK